MSQLSIWAIRVLSLVACGIAVFLFTQSSSTAGLVGCGEGCDEALASRWSVWFGVPVSLFGAVAYAGVFVSSLLVGRRNLALDALGWRGLELFVPLTVGAAVWFVGLQATGATGWCHYCLAVHACGALIAVATVLHRRSALGAEPRLGPVAPGVRPSVVVPHRSASAAPPPPLGVATLLAALGLGALLVGQLGFPPPGAQAQEVADLDQSFDLDAPDEGQRRVETSNAPPDEPAEEENPLGGGTTDDDPAPEEEPFDLPPIEETSPATVDAQGSGSRTVSLLKGQLNLDVYEHAVIGSREAPYVIAELMDYKCANCRKFHELSKEALKRYDGKLAFVVMPSPFDGDCNQHVRTTKAASRGGCELAKLSLAIARERPRYFEAYHNYLLSGDKAPSFSNARQEAEKYMEITELMAAMGSQRTERQMEDYVNLWAALAKGNRIVLPCQFVKDNVVPGLPKDVDALCQIWEKYLGIEPTGAPAGGSSLSGLEPAGED